MQPLTVNDIQTNTEYEKERNNTRKAIGELRALRRVELSDAFIVIFENRDTVRYQVQEMLRVERTDTPERIALELSCFNLLIPGKNELSATLMIRVKGYASVEERIERMKGLTSNVIVLAVGAETIPARFEIDDDVACESDVLYIRFPFTEEQCAMFYNPSVPVSLRCTHTGCSAEAGVEGELRASLIKDLLQ